jgi:tetratricopeptide (TPR) repeat protein/predicted Ser/Thr protein kinase
MSCPDDNELWALAHGEMSGQMRARLDAHIDGCSACRAVLGALARVQAPAPRPAAVRSPGATFGRYVILEAIGAGGMGVVYRAFDPELDRAVALKLVRTLDAGAQARLRERLAREARLLARISHPNVVAIHDVGVVDDEVFLAMEFVAGSTLAAWQTAAPRRWTQILDLYLQAARGLAKAHELGIVHRDFKASNALIDPDGRVRVVDFGLARTDDDLSHGTGLKDQAIGDLDTAGAGLTSHGLLLGTPAYMAPEQRLGQPADARSDQYSLCVALREALLGDRPPAAGPSPTTVPMTADARPTGGLRGIPRWLQRVLQRGLMADPAARWPDMHALIAACERGRRSGQGWLVLAGLALGLLALAVWLGPSRPTPPPLCQGAAVELAGVWDAGRRASIGERFVATGPGYAATTWSTTATALDANARAWSDAHTRVCEATRVHGHQSETDLTRRMRCLDDRRAALQQTVALLARADPDVIEHAVELAYALPNPGTCVLYTGDDPIDRDDPSVRYVRDRIAEAAALAAAGRYAAARSMLAAPLQIAGTHGWQGLLADGETILADALERLDEPAAAEDALYRAVWAAEAARDDARTTRAWTRLAPLIAEKPARPAEARRAIGHARAAYARHGAEPDLALALARSDAIVAIAEGRYAAARDILGAALAATPLPADDPRRINALKTYGAAFNKLGSAGRGDAEIEAQTAAAEQFRRALAIAEPRLGAEHPDVGALHHNLGDTLLGLQDFDGAEAEARRAVAIDQASLGPNNGTTAVALTGLATVLMIRGRLDLAAEQYRQALAIFDTLPFAHPNESNAAYNFGACLDGLGDNEGALRSFQRAADVERRTDAPDLGLYLITVGFAQNANGTPVDAIAPLEEALTIVHDPRQLVDARFELARALWSSRRDRPRARALARQALDGLAELLTDDRRRAEHAEFEDSRVKIEAWLAAPGR